FLDEHGGVTPFYWADPHGTTAKYICQDYEISQRKGNFWEISLKFEQTF
ncbi:MULTISPECIES: phage tail protein, partial [unclassified Moraxella]